LLLIVAAVVLVAVVVAVDVALRPFAFVVAT